MRPQWLPGVSEEMRLPGHSVLAVSIDEHKTIIVAEMNGSEGTRYSTHGILDVTEKTYRLCCLFLSCIRLIMMLFWTVSFRVRASFVPLSRAD